MITSRPVVDIGTCMNPIGPGHTSQENPGPDKSTTLHHDVFAAVNAGWWWACTQRARDTAYMSRPCSWWLAQALDVTEECTKKEHAVGETQQTSIPRSSS